MYMLSLIFWTVLTMELTALVFGAIWMGVEPRLALTTGA